MSWVAARILVVCAALAAGNPMLLSAVDEDYAGAPVLEIRFEPERQPLPPEELAQLLPFRVGDSLSPALVRQAIQALFATGRYTDIVVEAQRQDYGVNLRIRTTGNWFIGQVTVAGVPEPPNTGQLVAATKLGLGEEYVDRKLQEALENLRKRLEDNGFFEFRMDCHVARDPTAQQVRIDFNIHPGPRARLTRPRIHGVAGDIQNALVDATGWKRWWGLLGWHELTERRLQNGLDRVRRYFSRQNYLLSRVSLDQMQYDSDSRRVQPSLSIDLGPRVRLTSSGAALSQGRLRQLVPVFTEQSADRDLLEEGVRNLTEYMQMRGYFRSRVSFDIRQEAGDLRVVDYRIDPGKKYRLAGVRISGNRYFDEATIRERMSILPATWLRYRSGRFSEAMLEGDVAAISELYRSNGFRDVRIRTRIEENAGGRQGNLLVHIVIEEGQQWLVDHLELAGVSPERRSAIEPLINSISGQPFSEAGVGTDRDNILNYYFNHGFPDAAFDWTVKPSATPGRVDLRFQVTEGEARYVRGFLISGLRDSDPELVSTRIRLRPGDLLSQAEMIETQRRLYDLGVFARVDMALQNPEGQERSKLVLYQFEEARKYSLNLGLGAEVARIGAGAATFDAPAGEPGFSPRFSVGISRSNVFGVGHTASIQTRLSNIQRRAAFTYLAPQFKGSENTALTINGFYDFSRDIRTFASRRQEGSIQIAQRLSRANTFQVRFAYRRNTIDEGSLKISPDLIPVLARPVRVGMMSATFIQDRRDDPIESSRGYYNSVDFGQASQAFASQSNFSRLLARNTTYHRLGRETILARATTIGWIHLFEAAPNEGPGRQAGLGERLQDPLARLEAEDAEVARTRRGVPLPERFFSGGAGSHRGFPDNQAGPRDLRTGFPLGGSALLMNNIELRFPLLGDNVGGVLFHDAGNVYADLKHLSFRLTQKDLRDFNYMVHAVGFGVRYRTPVGPLRLDLAFSPNSPRFFGFRGTQEDLIAGRGELVNQRINRLQFHFSLGQTF